MNPYTVWVWFDKTLPSDKVRTVIIPMLHYLLLKYIPLKWTVFKNVWEGDEGEERVGSVRGMRESSVTGFQEDRGRHRRRGGCCECKNDKPRRM